MKYFPIELDKTRNLRYGMVAMDRIEKKLKKNVTNINLEDLSIYEMAVFLWGGLSHEDSKLTPERVMELVDEHSNMQAAMEVMAEAFSASFPQANPLEVESDSKNE